MSNCVWPSAFFLHQISIFQAYHRGHWYPLYTWILYGWYDSGWWRRAHTGGPESRNCSDEEIASVLGNSFAFHVYPKPSEKDAISDTGIVSGVAMIFVALYKCLAMPFYNKEAIDPIEA